MSRWFIRILGIFVVALVAGCGGGDNGGNVVQTLNNDSRFSTMVQALQAADLTSTLAEPGPYTVFAPTNDAFTRLLTELNVTQDQLFADKALLTSVLKYHVLAGQVNSGSIPLGKPIDPIGGGYFKIDKVGSGLVITDGRNRQSNIIQADIPASNGVIHAIDTVLLPADKTVVQTAMANPDFSIFVDALNAAGLTDTLNGTGPFTVFAPTNEAFTALLAELNITEQQLLANTALLTKVLTYHVVPGLVLKASVPVNTPIKTLEGETFTVSPSLVITDQRGRQSDIVTTDVLASNGVIHVLDKVLLPAP